MDRRAVEDAIYERLCSLIDGAGAIEIYLGNNGDFDSASAFAIERVKRRYGNEDCFGHLVLPYERKNAISYADTYDSVIIADLGAAPPKWAIPQSNRWIIDRCEVLVCFANKDYGGAYAALKYARGKGKRIINIAESEY